MKHEAFVSLGSNMNDPRRQVLLAMDAIHALPGTRVVKASSLYETDPVGILDQPKFINAVVKLETELPPLELLEALLRIESDQGRIRTIKNGPRTLDCDLILYAGVTMNTQELVLPHPRMYERDFVLRPLAEIEPEWSKL